MSSLFKGGARQRRLHLQREYQRRENRAPKKAPAPPPKRQKGPRKLEPHEVIAKLKARTGSPA